MTHGANQQSEGGTARRPVPLSIHRTDLGLALVLLAICGFLWWETTRFAAVPASLAQNAPPTTFPRLLLGAIAIMAVLLPFEHRFNADGSRQIDRVRNDRLKAIVFVTAAVLVAIISLTPWLGSLPTMILSSAVIPLLWGERRYGILAAFAIGLPLIVAFVFSVLLEVNLVAGITGDLFG